MKGISPYIFYPLRYESGNFFKIFYYQKAGITNQRGVAMTAFSSLRKVRYDDIILTKYNIFSGGIEAETEHGGIDQQCHEKDVRRRYV